MKTQEAYRLQDILFLDCPVRRGGGGRGAGGPKSKDVGGEEEIPSPSRRGGQGLEQGYHSTKREYPCLGYPLPLSTTCHSTGITPPPAVDRDTPLKTVSHHRTPPPPPTPPAASGFAPACSRCLVRRLIRHGEGQFHVCNLIQNSRGRFHVNME